MKMQEWEISMQEGLTSDAAAGRGSNKKTTAAAEVEGVTATAAVSGAIGRTMRDSPALSRLRKDGRCEPTKPLNKIMLPGLSLNPTSCRP